MKKSPLEVLCLAGKHIESARSFSVSTFNQIKQFIFLICLLAYASTSFGNHPSETIAWKSPTLDDSRRYLALMFTNDNEDDQYLDVIENAHSKGFNAFYLTVRMDAVKCHNQQCMIGANPNPSWNPANRSWTQSDAQIAKAKQLGMKIGIRIHLGNSDFGGNIRSSYLWGPGRLAMDPNGNTELGGYNFTKFTLSSQPAIDSAKNFVQEVLNRYGYLEGEGNLLFISFSNTSSQELEYDGSNLIDYSTASKNEYASWYLSNYGVPNPNVPTDFTSTEGKKWYKFRHCKLKNFVSQLNGVVRNHNSNIKIIHDVGSAFDVMSAKRGTLGFKSLAEHSDGFKVNDGFFYDHRFSMDILRGSLPGKMVMNEAFLVNDQPAGYYTSFANDVFRHGGKLLSLVTVNNGYLNQFAGDWSSITSSWISGSNGNMSTVNANGTVNYSFNEILNGTFNGNTFSSGARNIYGEWQAQYNSNPSNGKPVNVVLDDSELNCSSCTPPSAPILSASPATINQGDSTTLTASGCSGTVTWSDGLGTGTSKKVSPSSNKTYSASCSLNGCSSGQASVNVTVQTSPGGSFNQCLESESSTGNGAVTSDPNASNGNTRGEEGNNNHYVDYAITGVLTAGTYSVTLRYYSSSAPTVSVSVNSGTPQTLNLANSGSWNIVSTDHTFSINLAAGNNILRIQGTGGGSCRQDKICVVGSGGGQPCTPPSAPSLSASPSTIFSGNSTTLSASGCAGTITWSHGLGTGTSKSVSPTSNTTYTAKCSVNNCESSDGSVLVTVEQPSGGPFNQCLESELSTGDGTVTSDPNASNGETRGTQGNYSHYVDYAVTGVPSAATYYVTLRYYSDAAPTVVVKVNNSTPQTVNLANSGSWNIVWTTQQFSVTLQAGSNTIRIYGTGGGTCRQDKICVSSGSPAVLGVDPVEANSSTKKLTIYPNPSNGLFQTNFYLQKGKKGTISVTDIQGRIVYQQQVVGQGFHIENINLANKASGIMTLRLITDKAIEVKRFNVLR